MKGSQSQPKMLLFLISFSLFLSSVNSQYRFNCDENFCSTKGNECPDGFSCENGRTVHNATKCGCCPICIKSLKENEECVTTYYGWSQRAAECGPGLVCKKTQGNKAKCVASKCLERQKNYTEEYASDNRPLLEPTFECDYFGNFEASEDGLSKPFVVCIKDVLCFCVDKHGKRIFGTDFAKKNKYESNMNCNCSRDINDFPNAVDPEKLPRCLPNGNYDPLQCSQNKCFCMESSIRDLEDEVVNGTSAIKKLSCYDEVRHEKSYTTQCIREREEQMRHHKKKNMTAIGIDRIRCDLDGSYSPMQCKKRRCFCVNRNGEKHNSYQDVSEKDGQMICRCLRDKEIIQSYENKKTQSMTIFEGIQCNENYTSNSAVISGTFISDFMKK